MRAEEVGTSLDDGRREGKEEFVRSKVTNVGMEKTRRTIYPSARSNASSESIVIDERKDNEKWKEKKSLDTRCSSWNINRKSFLVYRKVIYGFETQCILGYCRRLDAQCVDAGDEGHASRQ